MACIDLPAFPLQLLLRREPSWRLHPAAVVESDRPGALLLHVNELAWQKRILPGMRYAAALSLSGDLRAAPISTRRIDSALSGMVRLLGRFSPEVEPDCDNPGLFWVNASGLVGLFDSFEEWARLIRADLSRNELEATVVIGFSRFATGVVAKARRGVTIFKNRAHEETAARAVPLDRLSISRSMGDILEKLGVTTLGAFADLPPEGIQKRFGKDAGRLHRLARGEEEDPFQPVEIREKPGNRDILEYAEKNLTRLIFLISRGLDPVLKQLADRDQALRELRIELLFDGGGRLEERIRPAEPTLDARRLIDLVFLRLQSALRGERVTEVGLSATGMKATRKQLELFSERARRDFAAADRALARIRAEFGDGAVVRARLREGHLPEASFSFEPCGGLRKAAPRDVRRSALVRRIFLRPVPLTTGPRHTPDAWALRSVGRSPLVRLLGPYIVSGGWWQRTVHREYHFAETKEGEILWVYYDGMRRRWFLQGRVE
jgi:protein ImuB